MHTNDVELKDVKDISTPLFTPKMSQLLKKGIKHLIKLAIDNQLLKHKKETYTTQKYLDFHLVSITQT